MVEVVRFCRRKETFYSINLRLNYNIWLTIDFHLFRSRMNRVKFNSQAFEWSTCMATCPKYNRAVVPSYSNKAELDEMIQWLYDTTTDPITKTLYKDAFGISIWLPFRF